jgi:DNA-binding transcriptional LysR family regulator
MFLSELADFSLQSLRVFVHVATLGSVAEAAKTLGLTQPAVSLQIQNLERQIGQAIFEKQGRRNVLTGKGEALLRKLLPELERLEKILTESRENQKGQDTKLFFGSVEGFGEYWLRPKIMEFLKVEPNARFLWDIAESDKLEEELRTGQLSLILTTKKIEDQRVVSQVLIEEKLAPVGKKEEIDRLREVLKKSKKSDRFWEHFKWIGYGDTEHYDPWSLRWIEAQGFFVDRRFKYSHRVNSFAVVRDFVARGLGLSITPLHTMHDDLKNKTLFALEGKDFPPLVNTLYLSYREGSLNSTHEAFRDWLLRVAKEN